MFLLCITLLIVILLSIRVIPLNINPLRVIRMTVYLWCFTLLIVILLNAILQNVVAPFVQTFFHWQKRRGMKVRRPLGKIRGKNYNHF